MATIRIITLIITMTGLAGCTTFELEGSGSITPDAITGSETVHGSLYGFAWREFAVEKCGTGSLFRVEYHTNALLLLASVATLGLYVPQTIEWWCHTPINETEKETENEEVWVPPTASGLE